MPLKSMSRQISILGFAMVLLIFWQNCGSPSKLDEQDYAQTEIPSVSEQGKQLKPCDLVVNSPSGNLQKGSLSEDDLEIITPPDGSSCCPLFRGHGPFILKRRSDSATMKVVNWYTSDPDHLATKTESDGGGYLCTEFGTADKAYKVYAEFNGKYYEANWILPEPKFKKTIRWSLSGYTNGQIIHLQGRVRTAPFCYADPVWCNTFDILTSTGKVTHKSIKGWHKLAPIMASLPPGNYKIAGSFQMLHEVNENLTSEVGEVPFSIVPFEIPKLKINAMDLSWETNDQLALWTSAFSQVNSRSFLLLNKDYSVRIFKSSGEEIAIQQAYGSADQDQKKYYLRNVFPGEELQLEATAEGSFAEAKLFIKVPEKSQKAF